MSIRLLAARGSARALVSSALAALVVLATGSGDAVAYTPPTYTVSPFHSYVVAVNSMQLVSSTGKKVQLLSSPLPIDFAQIVDLEDAVYSGLVPTGDYIAANLVLDYSQANITVDDGTGKIVALHPIDSNGARLTGKVAVTLKLDRYRHFVVSNLSAALYSFDVDLAATTKTDLANSLVYVGPTLIADVVASGSQWVKVSGSLASVSTDAVVVTVPSTRTINSLSGPLTVELGAATKYTIQGSAYVGAAGEAILTALPRGTKISATGSLHKDRKTLAAATIVAG